MAYEMELINRIYSGDGFFYEISPDADGIGNIILRYFDYEGDKDSKTIALTIESIPLIIKALETQLRNSK